MSDDRFSEPIAEGESFLSRWSRRKQESKTPEDESTAQLSVPNQEQVQEQSQEQKPLLTDADMPSIESLDERSDYSGFLSPEVSEALRQQALQKLFRSSAFNICDGLDDYAEDFTRFDKLGDVMTADLRHRLRQEAKRAAEKAETASREQEETASEDQRLSDLQEQDPDSIDATSRLQGDRTVRQVDNDEDETES